MIILLIYILKRILQAIPLLLVISILCFTLIQTAPFDAVDTLITPKMSQETVALIKERYGLDKPAYVQYFYWLGNVLQGDLGYSITTHGSIAKEMAAKIPKTMILVLPAYAIAVVISIVLGLVAGLKKGKWLDKLIDGFCSIAMSIPVFWFAMILLYIFGYTLKAFPILGMHAIGKEDSLPDFLHHFVLPCITLTVAFIPDQLRYIRSSTIGQLSEDYVMVQKAYGAKTHEILFRHVIKNVLLPIITLVGMSLPIMVTGAFVTETIFAWPGVGPYFVKSIQSFDYPVVLAILLLSSSAVIIGNLFSDVMYAVIDPRIRQMKG